MFRSKEAKARAREALGSICGVSAGPQGLEEALKRREINSRNIPMTHKFQTSLSPHQPEGDFVIRVYTADELGGEVVFKGKNISELTESFDKAIKAARRKSLLDGKQRCVRYEQSLVATTVWANGPLQMTQECKRLFMAEIDNEENAGGHTSTLRSALENLKGGYEPFEGFDFKVVVSEVHSLIFQFGDTCPLESFITVEDWKKRAG